MRATPQPKRSIWSIFWKGTIEKSGEAKKINRMDKSQNVLKKKQKLYTHTQWDNDIYNHKIL